jgi:hypothetical protein
LVSCNATVQATTFFYLFASLYAIATAYIQFHGPKTTTTTTFLQEEEEEEEMKRRRRVLR